MTLDHLWRTHRVFNERLPLVLSVLFRMRRGECGENDHERNLYKLIAEFILARNAKDGPYLLHSVSIKDWNPATAKRQTATLFDDEGHALHVAGDVWADKAAQLSSEGKLLFDKHTVMGDVPDTLRQGFVRQAVEIISGYSELLKLWVTEHEDWLHRKDQWERDNPQYMAVRPKFEEFEHEAGGKASKRRQRWHKYLTWLRHHPELAAWRGGAAALHPISPKGAARVATAKPWKFASIEAEEFWAANPELHALDRLHGYYESEFVRRRKTKKNPDGFDHRPTFTEPDPLVHPRWFVFNAPQTSPSGYRKLELPRTPRKMGSIELRLLTGEKVDGKYPEDWVGMRFKADPRLADFRPVVVKREATKGAIKGQAKERHEYTFTDRHLGAERDAQISGAKLILKHIRLNDDGSLRSAVPYLVFTCNVESVPVSTLGKGLKWVEDGGVTKTGKRRKRVTIPDGLLACAIDVGVRNVAFATVAEYRNGVPRVLRSRNISMGHEEESGDHKGRWQEGPSLIRMAAHKRELKHLRSLRGKPVRDEESHVDLQGHITHMGEDRFKRGARAVINFALNVEGDISIHTSQPFPRADVLIVEDLKWFNPDATREHGINRMLMAFNRGQLMQRIEEVCADVGVRLMKVNAYGTSQVCSRCGALGRRYSIASDGEGSLSDIRFEIVGKLFACAECGYRANADHNASVNLHRRFALGDAAIAAMTQHRTKTEREQKAALEEVEAAVREDLRRMHQIGNQTLKAAF
jgi:hypothetical protein